jgi:hypothetical protein
MKALFGFILLFVLIFTGCNEGNSSHNNRIRLLGAPSKTTGVNPNSLAYRSADKVMESHNKLELSKLENEAKIKIAKIRSENELNIAKINAEAKKSIAQTDFQAKVKSSEMDAKISKENMRYTVYIVIAIAVVILFALLLLYFNSKKNRELKRQLHEEKLKHEQFLKEKELEEQRVHKLLELIASGKVAKNVEKEVILSIAKPKEEKSDIIIEKKD